MFRGGERRDEGPPKRLRRSVDLAAYVHAPEGAYLAGRTFAYWSLDGTFGFALWGRPDAGDLVTLARALECELTAAALPHVSLIDARRLEAADPAAFDVLAAYVRRNAEALRAKVTRLAIVRPAGMPGAVVGGFYQVLDPPYPTRLFGTTEGAAEWLGLAPGVAAAVDEVVRDVTGTDPVLAALRAVLRSGGPRYSIGAAARAIAVSTRTLQRRLADSGTSFQAEAQRARLERAQARLLESDEPLTAIASEAGFASLQHFSGTFRRLLGVSPRAWRARQRG